MLISHQMAVRESPGQFLHGERSAKWLHEPSSHYSSNLSMSPACGRTGRNEDHRFADLPAWWLLHIAAGCVYIHSLTVKENRDHVRCPRLASIMFEFLGFAFLLSRSMCEQTHMWLVLVSTVLKAGRREVHIKAKRSSICRLPYHAHPGLRNLADLMTRLFCKVWFAMFSSVRKLARTIWQVCQLCPSCLVKMRIISATTSTAMRRAAQVSQRLAVRTARSHPNRQLHASQWCVLSCQWCRIHFLLQPRRRQVLSQSATHRQSLLAILDIRRRWMISRVSTQRCVGDVDGFRGFPSAAFTSHKTYALSARHMAVRAIVGQVIRAESSSNGCASNRRISNPSKLCDHVVHLTRCTGAVASPRFFAVLEIRWVLGFR